MVSQVTASSGPNADVRVRIITRHSGAVEWLSQRGVLGEVEAHLDIKTVKKGDVLVGILPPALILDAQRLGASVYLIVMDLPESARGRADFSVKEMEGFGARLERVVLHAYPVSPERFSSDGLLRPSLADPPAAAGAAGAPLRLALRRFFHSLSFALPNGVRGRLKQLGRWLGFEPFRLAVSGGIAAAILAYCVEYLRSVGLTGSFCFLGDQLRGAGLGGILWASPGTADKCVEAYKEFALFPMVFAGLGAGLMMLIGIYAVRQVQWSRLDAVPDSEDKTRVLITGLSRMTPAAREKLGIVQAAFAGAPEIYVKWQQGEGASHDNQNEINRLLNEKFPDRNIDPAVFGTSQNWQQLIRAIEYHRTTLERVLVLPSTESLKLWDQFAAPFLEALLGPNVRVGRQSDPVAWSNDGCLTIDLVRDQFGRPFEVMRSDGQSSVAYESYDHAKAGLEAAIQQAHLEFDKLMARPNLNVLRFPHQKLFDEDICVDITAGQKMFSVAAAVVTFNRDLKICYVDTNSGIVFVYDASIGIASN
ncbi:CRISPR-associated protein Csx16 [Rhabdaerophilum sp. SD176]|uniref:CRISPR-associated protein Csx16 n=1 Tax=Rhabdaerophilum sp. SD176 TaxID=2983548 RepID=UPI0024E03DEE|nr:CRISPR-associated protein Csx16 [Rhabdaerophilum sp. SD176]